MYIIKIYLNIYIYIYIYIYIFIFFQNLSTAINIHNKSPLEGPISPLKGCPDPSALRERGRPPTPNPGSYIRIGLHSVTNCSLGSLMPPLGPWISLQGPGAL